MRVFKAVVVVMVFGLGALWIGLGLADTTAYNIESADSTYGIDLGQDRMCISVLALDADASLQVYFDGTRLDSFPIPAGVGVDYWGRIDSLNFVRPTATRAIVLLGQPDGRQCPSISGGADFATLETTADNIYSRLDSIYHNGWVREVVYEAHDATSADTTFLATGWGEADGGRIYLQVNGVDIAHSGGEPLLIAKMVEEGFWNTLYLQSSIADPTDTLVIGDGANSYNMWLATGYGATLKNITMQSTVFGDSICVIFIPDDASAGTVDITGRYKEE